MSEAEDPVLVAERSDDDDAAAHVSRALRVRAETAALVRAAEVALDQSEAALRRLRRLEALIRAQSRSA